MRVARLAVSAVAASLCFSASAQAQSDKDIVDTAVEAGTFNTLAAALTAADLIEVLKGEGPFTVFAPTDEAFAKLNSKAPLNHFSYPRTKISLSPSCSITSWLAQ